MKGSPLDCHGEWLSAAQDQVVGRRHRPCGAETCRDAPRTSVDELPTNVRTRGAVVAAPLDARRADPAVTWPCTPSTPSTLAAVTPQNYSPTQIHSCRTGRR
jgi:hypothetical protein